MPSMRGISTSSVMTSGTSVLDASCRRERIGRGANHLDIGVGWRALLTVVCRTRAESSTMSTFTGSFMAHDAGIRCWPNGCSGRVKPASDFRMTEKQKAARPQVLGEPCKHRALCRLVEVDQHIAAEDHVEVLIDRSTPGPSD